MALEIALLLAGLLVLAKSSSVTITNAMRFSAASGISTAAIGFVFIAVATSLPEFSIAVIASLRGEGLLSLGNLAGANIVNLTLVVGVMAWSGFSMGKIYSLKIDQAVIATSFVAFALLVLGGADIATGLFCLVLFYLFSSTVMKEGIRVPEGGGIKTLEMATSFAYLLASVLLVVVSAWLVTDNAVKLSALLGLSESVIGATIVALGTTLPELSVGIAAVKRGDIGLAVGDTVGSIVANMTLILGAAALIRPIAIDTEMSVLLGALIAVNIVFLALVYRRSFGRREATLLIGMFAAYIALMYGMRFLL